MTAKRNASQLTLVPANPPVTEHVRVPIDDLLKGKLTGPAPDHDFVESIRNWGVLVPILVERSAKGWKLVAGKRRVKAVAVVRDQGPPDSYQGTAEEWAEQWGSVPAEQIHNDGWRPASAGLVENEQRSDNFSDLVDELETMVADGLSEQEIRAQTLVPVVRIRRALRVTQLHRVLREAFRNGRIVRQVAEQAARCTPEQQAQLVKVYKAEDQLTLADVREVRKAGQRAAQEALAGLGEGDFGEVWRDEVCRKLREALALVPEAEGELRSDLRLLIDAVDPLERVTKAAVAADDMASVEEDAGAVVSAAAEPVADGHEQDTEDLGDEDELDERIADDPEEIGAEVEPAPTPRYAIVDDEDE